MKRKLFRIIKLLRPKQWIKNFALFAPILFTGQLFNEPAFYRVTLGFITFCGLSSAMYIMNDIADIDNDRMHPFKRFRPLAHKDISVKYAYILFFVLILSSLLLASH